MYGELVWCLKGRRLFSDAASKRRQTMNDSTTRRHTGDAGDMYFTAVIGPAETPTSALALLDIETADDIDAKYQMMVAILRDDTNPGPVTSKKNILMQHVYRGIGD